MDAEVHDIDLLEIWRCPQLGGPVTLGYCRAVNEGLPCGRLISCWGGSIDVASFLEAHYTAEQLQAAFGQPAPDRLTRILDALRKAKEPRR